MRVKTKITVDEVELGISQGKTFAEIGAGCGLTRERIRQIYAEKLKTSMGGLSWHDLQKLATRHRHDRELLAGPRGGLLGRVWGMLEGAGLAVSRYAGAGSKQCARHLVVNGWVCSVHHVTKLWRYSTRSYYHFQIGLRNLRPRKDFALILVGEDLLVIPRGVMTSGHLFIPEHSGAPVYNNRSPKVDWWSYANAWSLLERKQERGGEWEVG